MKKLSILGLGEMPTPKGFEHIGGRKSVLLAIAITLAGILAVSSFLVAFAQPSFAWDDENEEGTHSCNTLTLVSGTTTKTAGWTSEDPATDSLEKNRYSDASSVAAVATETVIPPWVNPTTDTDFAQSGALWVSTDDTWPGGTGNGEGNATSSSWRLFTDSFTLPVGAIVSDAQLWYTGDNAVAIYQNGNKNPVASTGGVYGTSSPGNEEYYSEVSSTSFTPKEGYNTLEMVVRNWDTEEVTNPTGLLYKAVVTYCVPDTNDDNTVTVVKYIDGVMATGVLADNADFPMSSTWSGENVGTGTGAYVLSELGFNGSSTPYKAVTTGMDSGASYSTYELTDGSVVGTSCEAGKPFALRGYTTGNTMAEARTATLATTTPSFTNLTSDKYVIVWNTDCRTPVPEESVRVTVSKFVNGRMATAGNAQNADFPMSATWSATNTGTGTAAYVLSEVNTIPYQAKTATMTPGASYRTEETLSGGVVGSACGVGKPFALRGYTSGNTQALAMAATLATTTPSFTNLTSDKYVIVWNTDCSATSTEGQIGGDVEGGEGALSVTRIEMVDTTGTANGTFADGWKYVFFITAPLSEEKLALKFSDWVRTGGGGTIPVASTMRISSAQASNGTTSILIAASNVYSSPALVMTQDLDASMAGRQVAITVELAIPSGTPVGAYTTNYGVQSTE
jgi:hypothetical protein